MIQLRPQDAIHKSFLNRILIEIADSPLLSQQILFKGGTCASMLGYLDRFSIDLDFDMINSADETELNEVFLKIFSHLGLEIVSKAKDTLFYNLKYSNKSDSRNSLKFSCIKPRIDSNIYKVQFFPEIDRLINSQTIETMFSNKLVAITDRYQKYKTIAGRDIYDIHHFFVQGYSFIPKIIKDRTGKNAYEYLIHLKNFIKENVSATKIDEDLNSLLPQNRFQAIRKVLIPETLYFLGTQTK